MHEPYVHMTELTTKQSNEAGIIMLEKSRDKFTKVQREAIQWEIDTMQEMTAHGPYCESIPESILLRESTEYLNSECERLGIDITPRKSKRFIPGYMAMDGVYNAV